MFSSFLPGKTALITGSTSGIGLGIAEELYKAGANIVLNGMATEGIAEHLQNHFKTIEGSGDILFIPADLTQTDSRMGLIEKTIAHFETIDILINNAGMQHVAAIEEFTLDKWNQLLMLNLTVPFLLTQKVLPPMRKKNWGRIINIASAHGHVASEKKAAYVSSKHGLVGLTKVVALETATTGITCNAICPGWVLTPLVQQQIDAIAVQKNIPVAVAEKELLSEKQPSLTFATPQQVGQLATFLCSPAADQITGSSQLIDGGWVAR